MIRLLALQAFPYAGGSISAGERFEAKSEFDAIALKRAGHAVDAPQDQYPASNITDLSSEVDPPKPPRRRRTEPVADGD